jgi:hypothetical protein
VPIQGLRQDVHLINCAAIPGGWSAGGTINNRGNSSMIYDVMISFVSANGKKLGSAVTSSVVASKGFAFWSASASLAAPSKVLCILKSVS